MRRRIFLLSALLLPAFATPARGEHPWGVVGFDPYEGSPEYVLGLSGWPDSVTQIFPKLIARREYVPSGVRGGMRFDFGSHGGKNPGTTPRVVRDVLVTWSHLISYNADLYVIRYEGMKYSLYRVHACGNWVGRSEKIGSPPAVVCTTCKKGS